MKRYPLQIRIVLFSLNTSWRVLTVRILLFCALQNYLNSITFLSHGYMLFLNGSAKIGNATQTHNDLLAMAVSFLRSSEAGPAETPERCSLSSHKSACSAINAEVRSL
jgi:hypothetical protein